MKSSQHSENALERALRVARADAGAWPTFFRTLLAAEIWALTPPGPPPAKGFIFIQWPLEDGTYVIPFFSSREAVIAGTTDFAVPTVRLMCRSLFEITRGTPLVLNPGLPTEAMFGTLAVEDLLANGVIGRFKATDSWPAADIAPLPEPPMSLCDALDGLFARLATVRRAWMVNAYPQGRDGESTILIAVDIVDVAESESVVRDVTAVIQTIAPELGPFDILTIDMTRGSERASFDACTAPFYDAARLAAVMPGSLGSVN